jgi:hypothetical protein
MAAAAEKEEEEGELNLSKESSKREVAAEAMRHEASTQADGEGGTDERRALEGSAGAPCGEGKKEAERHRKLQEELQLDLQGVEAGVARDEAGSVERGRDGEGEEFGMGPFERDARRLRRELERQLLDRLAVERHLVGEQEQPGRAGLGEHLIEPENKDTGAEGGEEGHDEAGADFARQFEASVLSPSILSPHNLSPRALGDKV